jgi:predicted enzyme related to lactoylglutathione lyase
MLVGRMPGVMSEVAMNSPIRINYIELPASDLDAVERFYGEAFGWSFTDYGPEYRAFSDGAFDGGFRRAEQRSSSADGSALVVLKTEGLEAARDTVLRCGGTIVTEIFAFPGGRRFHFADPVGNELAVWSER